MRRRQAESSAQEPYGWSDEEINRYLAMHHRSVVDLAFIRGEKPP
jgi:hypothetical protein